MWGSERTKFHQSGCYPKYREFLQLGRLRQIPLTAVRFVDMMAELTIGWLLMEGAAISRAGER